MKLLNLVAKNFRLLVRSKTSALIIFIGPLLLVSLLGLAYSHTDNFTLTASIYSKSYSSLSESLVKKMINQNFQVERQDSLDNCINSVKRSEAQACIVFPAGMKIQEGVENTVTFYVDYSQLNLVWIILDVMQARVSERAEEITTDLTRDLLDRMWFVEDKLSAGKDKIGVVMAGAAKINNVSSVGRGDVTGMDVNVSFDVDVKDSKTNADQILLEFSDMRTDIDDALDSIRTGTDSIESSTGQIENQVDGINNTNVTEDVDNILLQTEQIREDTSNLDTNVGLHSQEMVDKVSAIKTALSTVSLTVEEAETKVQNVKNKKDGLVPIFDNINKDINDMQTNIRILESTLEQALDKIEAIQVKNAEEIANPINTEIKPISIQKTHFNSLFPMLLVLIIMITGILLGSIMVIGEKKTKAFFRNNMVPTSYFTFSLSTYLTALCVLFIQLLLFVSVAAFFFETQVLASLWLIILLVFLISTLFIIIGMFIGFLFSTEATSTLASITLTSIFLLFSRAVLPSEGLTEFTKKIVSYNPFVISDMALKQAVLFNFTLEKMLYSLGMLVGYAVGLFVLLLVLQDILRRLSFIQIVKTEKPHIVKEKKAEKKLVPEIVKVDNAANELLVEKK